MERIHWSGGAKIITRTRIDNRLKGWPCCCSGAAAYRIKYRGMMNGRDPQEVTCRSCRKVLVKVGLLEEA
jgi:hypothetical protein